MPDAESADRSKFEMEIAPEAALQGLVLVLFFDVMVGGGGCAALCCIHLFRVCLWRCACVLRSDWVHIEDQKSHPASQTSGEVRLD